MSNRNLIIILVVLLGIFLITKLTDRRGERNFRDVLVEIDSSKVDRILLHNVEDDQAVIELIKSGSSWTASNGEQQVPAQKNTINSLLSSMQLIKSKRLISRAEEKWADYEVNEEKGTRVEVYAGKKNLDDFYVGRFNFNQQARTATSYIRKADETDTYSVDGFLSMSFNQSFDSFRDKTLVKVNSGDINQIKYSGKGSSEELTKQDQVWVNSAGMALDSTKMASYVNGLSNTFGGEFDDEFSPDGAPSHSLEIYGDNMLEAINVDCYETPDTLKPFRIHSTMNDAAYFKSDSAGVYQKLFGNLGGDNG